MKSNKSPLKLAKKRAWRYFSEWVRLRDCLETTGAHFSCICCTCGKDTECDGSLHAGHFIPGRTNSVLFDEKNVHGQCSHCNLYLHGALDKYYVYMLKKYGQGEIDRLEWLRHQTLKISQSEYEMIALKYKEKIKKLQSS